jgi:signal transduction histidine kinase
LPENSLIIIPGFNSDKNNIPYYNPEAVRLIRKSTKAPIFTYSDMGFGDGSFGGRILSFKKTGLLAGETSVKILNGADPGSIFISDDMYYDNVLDWRELKKWNLTNLEMKKQGFTVLFKEVTLFGKYKWLILAGIIFLILQSSLIMALFTMNIRQKKMTHQINEAHLLYNELINEDRIQRMGMLTASLSHELNQPLTAILSTSQAGRMLIESGSPDPKLLAEIFNNIVEDDKRAASILKSIRGMMKLDKREKEKVNLNELIKDVAELYHSKAIELNSRITLELLDTPVYVIADAIQIQQVLLNLITNASNSMDRNQRITNLISINESIDGEFVSVSVRDFGKGIDENIIMRMFDPFVSSRKDGNGIGLAISKLIIEDHNGKIWARNMPDGGAEFSFNLKMHHV